MTTDERLDRIDQKIKHLVDLIESLSNDTHAQLVGLHEKFDRQDARLARHGGMLQGGARQITRLVEWSEKLDDLLAQRDAKIAALEARIARLEQRNDSAA